MEKRYTVKLKTLVEEMNLEVVYEAQDYDDCEISTANINRRSYARSFFCVYIIAAVIFLILLCVKSLLGNDRSSLFQHGSAEHFKCLPMAEFGCPVRKMHYFCNSLQRVILVISENNQIRQILGKALQSLCKLLQSLFLKNGFVYIVWNRDVFFNRSMYVSCAVIVNDSIPGNGIDPC